MSVDFLPCPDCGEKEAIVTCSDDIHCQRCKFMCRVKEWNKHPKRTPDSVLKMGNVLKRGRLYKTTKALHLFTSPKEYTSEQNIFEEGTVLMYLGYQKDRDLTRRRVKFIAPDGMVRYGLYEPKINPPIRLRELFEEVETS